MEKIQSYKDLIVWRKSMELVRDVYVVTENFPKDELYGLRSQMQRAAVSIPSNIAEGYLRGYTREYCQFLSISLGSAAELETQILICKSLEKFNNIDFSQIETVLDEIMKMLYVMIEKVKRRAKSKEG